jgi:hypothetical protein
LLGHPGWRGAMKQTEYDFAALGYSKRQSIFAPNGIYVMILPLRKVMAIGKQRINILSRGTPPTNFFLDARFSGLNSRITKYQSFRKTPKR